MPRLVYRVDGGSELGLGHIARAVALATAFQSRGSWHVVWATAGGRFVEAAARDAGATMVIAAPGEAETTLLARAADNADALLIDHKFPYTHDAIARLKEERPVVFLDVVCDGMFAASATVFPNAHLAAAVAADPRWRSSGRLHHGAEWAVIHPRIRQVANATPRSPGRPGVAVITGGSDPADVASRALDWLDAVPAEFDAEVFVGAANRNRAVLARRAQRSRHSTTVIDDPKQFPHHLAWSSVAVAAFGITAYELAYLGVPAVLVSHNRENADGAARFARHGCALDLGLAENVDRSAAADAIAGLLRDEATRERMRAAGQRLVDGHGAERVADLVEHLVREQAA